MSISSIQNNNYGNYSANKRVNSQSEIPSRTRGSDTVSISDEALRKVSDDSDDTKAKEVTTEKSSSPKISMLVMLMESLFMALIEDNEDNEDNDSSSNSDANGEQSNQSNAQQSTESQNTSAQSSGNDKPNGVLQESGKVLEIKQVINDFMFNGGDTTDVISAMSTTSTNTGASSAKNGANK